MGFATSCVGSYFKQTLNEYYTQFTNYCRPVYDVYKSAETRIFTVPGVVGQSAQNLKAVLKTAPTVLKQMQAEMKESFGPGPHSMENWNSPYSVQKELHTGIMTVAGMTLFAPSEGVVGACVLAAGLNGHQLGIRVHGLRPEERVVSEKGGELTEKLRNGIILFCNPIFLAKIFKGSLFGATRTICETGALTLWASSLAKGNFARAPFLSRLQERVGLIAGVSSAVLGVGPAESAIIGVISCNPGDPNFNIEDAIKTGVTAAAAVVGFSTFGTLGAMYASQFTGMFSELVFVVMNDPRYRVNIDECFYRAKEEIRKDGTKELLAQQGILDVQGSRVGAIIAEYAAE